MGLRVSGKTVLNDAVTGLIMAVINVPQGLANGVLAGVNPVFGLYSMIVGTTVAAFVTASVFMNVDSTSATALTAGEVLATVTSEEQLGYLVVLGLLGSFLSSSSWGSFGCCNLALVLLPLTCFPTGPLQPFPLRGPPESLARPFFRVAPFPLVAPFREVDLLLALRLVLRLPKAIPPDVEV